MKYFLICFALVGATGCANTQLHQQLDLSNARVQELAADNSQLREQIAHQPEDTARCVNAQNELRVLGEKVEALAVEAKKEMQPLIDRATPYLTQKAGEAIDYAKKQYQEHK